MQHAKNTVRYTEWPPKSKPLPSDQTIVTIQTSCAHFAVETDEKSSLNCGFLYDLMIISDSYLIIGPSCT